MKQIPDYKKKIQIMRAQWLKLYDNQYFKEIVNFIYTDFFRSMDEKYKSVLNKTLILSGESGFGKSSLLNYGFEPFCKAISIDPPNSFETSQINDPKTKILYLADDNDIEVFYKA